MRNHMFKSYLPLTELGEIQLAVTVGTVSCSMGELLDVRDMATRNRHRDQYVRDVIHCTIMDTPQAILEAYGCPNFSAFRQLLSARAMTGLPAELGITVVMLGEPDSEPLPLYVEEETLKAVDAEWDEITSDDDIPELVYPMEDHDDDELDI